MHTKKPPECGPRYLVCLKSWLLHCYWHRPLITIPRMKVVTSRSWPLAHCALLYRCYVSITLVFLGVWSHYSISIVEAPPSCQEFSTQLKWINFSTPSSRQFNALFLVIPLQEINVELPKLHAPNCQVPLDVMSMHGHRKVI
jgi:hypothetical protein